MTLDKILEGMYFTDHNSRLKTTHFGGQDYTFVRNITNSVKVYTFVRNITNSVKVSQKDDTYYFDISVYFEEYERWDSGTYRKPYTSYENKMTICYTELQLQSFPEGFDNLIRLYARLKYSVETSSEWKEIMRYFWKDWDFPETKEKKELTEAVENLATYINKDTPPSVVNVYLNSLASLNKLYPKK